MVRCNNLSFQYHSESDNNIPALKNINLTIPKGQCVVITGKSGCGKSTFMKMINGIISHMIEGETSGSILVNGRNPKEEKIQVLAEDVGSVFQNPKSQFFHLNTTDEIIFGCTNFKIEKEEILQRLKETSTMLDMEDLIDRDIFQLSGGEKQRVACASAYAHLPEIMVMDEPSSNLDHHSIEDLKRLIEKLKDAGKTIIIAEHRLYYLMDLADRVILLENGSVKEDVSPKEMAKIKDEDRKKMGLRSFTFSPIKDFRKQGEKNVIESSEQSEESEELTVKNLTVQYDQHQVLGISHSFKSNSVTAVVGRNGTGKSSFAKALCGLVESKGTIKTDHILSRKERNKRFFMVMQDVNHQLFAESVLDELLLGHENNEENRAKAMDILEKLHLDQYKDTHPLALSGGQKQRVAIAGAIFSGCEYLIFDEPTSGLDYEHMTLFSKIIDEVKDLVKLIIIITHDYELINLCCDDVFPLTEGPKVKEKSTIRMVLGFAESQKYKIILSSLFSAISSLLSIAPYLLIIAIIELIIQPESATLSVEQLVMWTIVAGMAFVVFFVLSLGLSHIAAFSVLHEIRVNVVKHLGHLPLGFFKRHSSGSIKKSLDEDVEKLELFIAHQIPDLVENLVVPLTVVIFLMFKQWLLGLLLFIPVVAFMVIQGTLMNKHGEKVRDYVERMGRLHSAIVEYIHGMNVFKAFNLGAGKFKSYKQSTEEYLKFWKSVTRDVMPYYSVSYVIVDSGLLFTLPIGGILFVRGTISGMDFISFLFLSSVFLHGLMKLLFMSRTLQMLLMGADNIKEIIESKEQRVQGETLDRVQGEVVVENLNFAYDEKEKNVLEDINLTFKPNTITALVGKSGSGKTTLGMLLGRFYDTPKGMIRIDGMDIQDMEFKFLMDQTAFVFQESFLISDSIYNNILLGLNRTREQVIQAAKEANIHDFIMGLEKGYETIIGDGSGIKLSGGEKQRISMARAMLKDAPIVVLDEVTSYSDIENEVEIQEAIKKLLKNRTGIVIAHRLYTIKDADHIAVLDEGRVIQEGTHDQLIATEGAYLDFWKEFGMDGSEKKEGGSKDA